MATERVGRVMMTRCIWHNNLLFRSIEDVEKRVIGPIDVELIIRCGMQFPGEKFTEDFF